ncbi:site-2 protease family protein [Anaerobaca lacustris]|uniref:Zinc metalloprotease n=1 Tax=Anaerobaca lacustris TaxID=3044600 RepID=A0AAW6U4D8_9BACT|nr:site-2 protease family protein [Sedimentisphaerales bacterium M17dextr]
MFERRIPLFRLFGFTVSIDVTWFVLAVLITWSLAKGAFPHYCPGFSNTTYWWMGVAGALGLFVSIIFHEFCHSLVARQFNLPMKGITLFIFGGVAEMSKEPESAKSEFFMAIAGPISSVILAGIFFLLYTAGKAASWPGPVNGVLMYLGWLNIILAGFNMVPAFPLDGGRILRSILWHAKGDLRWATRISSRLGAAFGLFLMILGVISFIGGNFIGGLWFFLIGMFIKNASQMSYTQLLVKSALMGEPISRFMVAEVVTVPPSIAVSDLVENYFYKYHYKMFPVTEDGMLKGCVTTKQIKELSKEQWATTKVSDIAQPCSEGNAISPKADAVNSLSLMNRTGNSRLMVVEGNRLLGVISLKDMLRFMALKLDLEAGERITTGPDISEG